MRIFIYCMIKKFLDAFMEKLNFSNSVYLCTIPVNISVESSPSGLHNISSFFLIVEEKITYPVWLS